MGRPSGLMESMLCSVRSVGAWMSSRRSSRLDLSLARLARRSSSLIVDNARNTHSGIDEKTNVKNEKKNIVNPFFVLPKSMCIYTGYFTWMVNDIFPFSDDLNI